MTSSTMTRKGQVTIPKPIREELDLSEGSRVVFFLRDDEVVLKALRGSILELEGSVTPHNRPEDFDRVRRTVRRSTSSNGKKSPPRSR